MLINARRDYSSQKQTHYSTYIFIVSDCMLECDKWYTSAAGSWDLYKLKLGTVKCKYFQLYSNTTILIQYSYTITIDHNLIMQYTRDLIYRLQHGW